jgi:hypothetical protein
MIHLYCRHITNVLNLDFNDLHSEGGCIGWNSCRTLTNGAIMENSCQSAQFCFGLEGRIHQGSCLGSNACKNSGKNSVIGQYSCTSNYACENNQADIGDCNCSTEYSCANNTSPISASPESCPATVSCIHA